MGNQYMRKAVLLAALAGGAISLLSSPALATVTVYRCTPSVKFSCDPDGCLRETDGFQHAESFAYDVAKKEISACLWTSCFAGKIKATLAGENSKTLVGTLKDQNRSLSGRTLAVSLTIDSANRFIAVWEYSGERLTFDQGVCINNG